MTELIDYDGLKAMIASKGLGWQYIEYDTEYSVFAVDNHVGYRTMLYKPGSEPLGCADCTANTTDFETNYKSGANKPIEDSVKYRSEQTIGVTKPQIGVRAWLFSHNFCDKTTWYGDSVHVVNEAVGTGDGAQVTFSLAHTFAIDMLHGKITDEDALVSTYKPVVTVGGAAKAERDFGETNGDYTIDYTAGTITFFTAPATSAAIVASYYYSPANAGSAIYIVPDNGYKLIITVAEAQFSEDMNMTDNLVSSVWTYNPYLGAPPARFEYPSSKTRYKVFSDFINSTNGSFPIIPAFGAAPRGLPQNIMQLRFDYQTALILDSSYGAQLRIWLEHHRPYTGYVGTIALYGYQEAL
jgi:hypothetical protein